MICHLSVKYISIGRSICNLKLKKLLYFILLLTVPSGLRVRSGSKYDEDYDGQPLLGVAELGLQGVHRVHLDIQILLGKEAKLVTESVKSGCMTKKRCGRP